MDSNKDIYHKDDPALPLRRKKKRSSSSSSFPTRSGKSTSTLHEELGLRTGRPRRKRHGARKMSLANRVILVLMVGVLALYLVFLGASLYRSYRGDDAAPPPAAVLERVESPSPESETEGARGPTDRVVADTLTEDLVRWKAELDQLSRASTEVRRGRLDAAVSQLESAVESAPHHTALKRMLADLYMEQKAFVSARDLYMEVLERNPSDGQARLHLAEALLALRQYESALVVANWLLEADAFLEQPNNIAALSLMALGRMDAASVHLQRLVNMNRDHIVYRNNLAITYSRLQEYDRAEVLLREVLSQDPASSVAYYNLAVNYARQDRAQPAVDVLLKASEQFGQPFVDAWLQSREFDPIRESPAFKNLSGWETSPARNGANPNAL